MPIAIVPTQEYPNLPADLWFGLSVANKSPGDRVQKLSNEISQILEEPTFREKYATFGVRISGRTPAELGALISVDGRLERSY